MRILDEIIERLDGYDQNKDYFDYTLKERDEIVSVLWDEVYSDYYINSLKGLTIDEPLKVQMNILSYLFGLLEDYETNEEFEICDVVSKLITITEHKIQTLDKHYADTK